MRIVITCHSTPPENYQSSYRKLTPVHHHPLMLNDSFEEDFGDTLMMSNASRNFPDVVLTHSTAAESSKISLATADIVNSVNNNNNEAKKINSVKPFYREPSPVSNQFNSSFFVF
jgi:hypothetical protein